MIPAGISSFAGIPVVSFCWQASALRVSLQFFLATEPRTVVGHETRVALVPLHEGKADEIAVWQAAGAFVAISASV